MDKFVTDCAFKSYQYPQSHSDHSYGKYGGLEYASEIHQCKSLQVMLWLRVKVHHEACITQTWCHLGPNQGKRFPTMTPLCVAVRELYCSLRGSSKKLMVGFFHQAITILYTDLHSSHKNWFIKMSFFFLLFGPQCAVTLYILITTLWILHIHHVTFKCLIRYHLACSHVSRHYPFFFFTPWVFYS